MNEVSPRRRDGDEQGLMRVAIAFIASAMFLMVAFQTYILVQAGAALRAARISQDQLIEDGNKLREQARSLAEKIATMANGGDANAQAVIDGLRRRGLQLSLEDDGTGGGEGASPSSTPAQ